MTTMISEVYTAFRSAGVDEETSRKAAEALSAESLATKGDVIRIERELAVIKWMVGLVIAGVAAQIIKGFYGG
jgi:hypothetical protein